MNTMQRGRRIPGRLLVVAAWFASIGIRGASEVQEPLPKYSDEGYLAGWFVIGPFPEQQGRAADPIDVARGDEPASITRDGREYFWEFAQPHAEPYRVDFATQFGSSEPGVAYATTEVYVNRDLNCELRIRSDERATVWINGERCTLLKRSALRRQTDVCRKRMRFGFNRIVVRIPHKQGPWGFRAQLLNEDGRPIAKKLFWLKEDPLQGLRDESLQGPTDFTPRSIIVIPPTPKDIP